MIKEIYKRDLYPNQNVSLLKDKFYRTHFAQNVISDNYIKSLSFFSKESGAIFNEIKELQITFPLNQKLFNVVWKNDILDDNLFLIFCSHVKNIRNHDFILIDSLAKTFHFDMYFLDAINKSAKEIYYYKYCVLVAAYNILCIIFDNKKLIHNIRLFRSENKIEQNESSNELEINSWHLSYFDFIMLLKYIPILNNTTFNLSKTISLYFDFWKSMLYHYNKSITDTYSDKLLAHYESKIDNNNSFNKKELLLLIKNNNLSDNALSIIDKVVK